MDCPGSAIEEWLRAEGASLVSRANKQVGQVCSKMFFHMSTMSLLSFLLIYVDGLVQERRYTIANALELCLS